MLGERLRPAIGRKLEMKMDVSGSARRFLDGHSGGRGRRILLVLLVLVAIAAVIGLAVWLVHRASATGPGGGFGRRGGRPMTTVSVAKAQLADFAASNSWRPALEDLADFAVARKA